MCIMMEKDRVDIENAECRIWNENSKVRNQESRIQNNPGLCNL